MFSNFFNRAIHQIMWKNIVERGRPKITIWRVRFACFVPKATNTNTQTHAHSEYVIHIAFPLQQWLQEHATALRYTYIACLLEC
jgi:hypothetical protein